MAGSFAQLAKSAENKKSSIAVPKEPLDKAPLEIYKLGNEILRTPADRVSKIDNKVRDLVKKMLMTMYSAKGIGLAAPQVGIPKRILVIDLEFENPNSPPHVFINPEILSFSASVETYEEGCLSIPGVYQNVIRPSSVKVSFRDEMGRHKKLNASGLLARCLQHEIDHFNGLLFVDKVEDKEALRKQLKDQGFNEKDVR